MGSSSRARTETSQNTQNESTNVNLQDVSGTAVGSVGGSVTINASDHGAIAAAQEIGVESLDTVGDVASDAFSFGEKAVDSNIKAVDSALDFGSGAVSAVRDANDRALDFGDSALTFGTKALETQAATQKQTTSTLSDAIERAAAASRTDSSQSLDKITKIGGVVVVVVVLAVAAVFIFKK